MRNTFKKAILLFVIIILTPSYALAHGALDIIVGAFSLFALLLFAGLVWFFVNSFRRLPRKKAVIELIIFLLFVIVVVLLLVLLYRSGVKDLFPFHFILEKLPF